MREDFNKERHFNELTRKNMLREVEMDMERSGKFQRMEVVRNEIFQSEVAAQAFSLAQKKEGLRYNTGTYTQFWKHYLRAQ